MATWSSCWSTMCRRYWSSSGHFAPMLERQAPASVLALLPWDPHPPGVSYELPPVISRLCRCCYQHRLRAGYSRTDNLARCRVRPELNHLLPASGDRVGEDEDQVTGFRFM